MKIGIKVSQSVTGTPVQQSMITLWEVIEDGPQGPGFLMGYHLKEIIGFDTISAIRTGGARIEYDTTKNHLMTITAISHNFYDTDQRTGKFQLSKTSNPNGSYLFQALALSPKNKTDGRTTLQVFNLNLSFANAAILDVSQPQGFPDIPMLSDISQYILNLVRKISPNNANIPMGHTKTSATNPVAVQTIDPYNEREEKREDFEEKVKIREEETMIQTSQEFRDKKAQLEVDMTLGKAGAMEEYAKMAGIKPDFPHIDPYSGILPLISSRKIMDLPALPFGYRWTNEVSGIFYLAPENSISKAGKSVPMLLPDSLADVVSQLTDMRWEDFLIDQAARLEGIARAIRVVASIARSINQSNQIDEDDEKEETEAPKRKRR